MANINQKIAQELGVRAEQVEATVALLDGGATVPFIARYRKEATGALDDAQLRTLEERLGYLRELEDRRKAILESVREQGKLDAALEACRLRLRPIVMTSVAFIAGTVPLVLSHGAGAEVRSVTGITVFAGMLGVTLFGLFLTPVFYVALRKLVHRPLVSHAAPVHA